MSTVATGPASSPAGKAAWIVLAIAWICFLIPVPGLGLFVGWPLNVVAFVLAIVAMSKGGATKGLFQLLASLIVTPIIFFIGIAVLTAIAAKPSYDDYQQRMEAQRAQGAVGHDASAAEASGATADDSTH